MAEMRYIDEKLWKVIQRFEELGDFDNTRTAQRKLAEKIETMPTGNLLTETKGKKEEEEPYMKI